MEDLESSQVMGPRFGYVDKFTKKDFMFWKFKMETMLKARDFQGFIDMKETKPKVITIATLATCQKKKKPCIEPDYSKFVKRPIVHYVKQSITKGIWDFL